MARSSALRRDEQETAAHEKADLFATELTDLCRKHGLGITGSATLFVMEYEDHGLKYTVNTDGNLILS
jgi:hypothetical protein